MINNFYDILISNGYSPEEEPISIDKPHVFRQKDKTIVKVTTDKAEIKAAKKILGVSDEPWAKIISVRGYEGYHIIVVEEVKPLNDNDEIDYRKFLFRLKIALVLMFIVKYVTFKRVKLTFSSFNKLYGDKGNVWLNWVKYVKKRAKTYGVEYPSDYLTDVGFRGDELVCFDMNDEFDSLFYENL